jgi:Clp amino terminal domain, pathogenicity island component
VSRLNRPKSWYSVGASAFAVALVFLGGMLATAKPLAWTGGLMIVAYCLAVAAVGAGVWGALMEAQADRPAQPSLPMMDPAPDSDIRNEPRQALDLHQPSETGEALEASDVRRQRPPQTMTAGAEQPSSGCHNSSIDLTAAIPHIPFAPPVELVLHAASARAELSGRLFLTADVLLAVLDLPDSAVEKCLERFSPGLAAQVRLRLRNVLESATRRPDYPRWRPFNLDLRREVLRARKLAAEGKDPEVTELHLLLGIIDNERSGIRRELASLLSQKGLDRLRGIAARMLTEPVTPGSEIENSP